MKKKWLKIFIFVVIASSCFGQWQIMNSYFLYGSRTPYSNENTYIVSAYPNIICLDSLGNIKWKKRLPERTGFTHSPLSPYIEIHTPQYIEYWNKNTGEYILRKEKPLCEYTKPKYSYYGKLEKYIVESKDSIVVVVDKITGKQILNLKFATLIIKPIVKGDTLEIFFIDSTLRVFDLILRKLITEKKVNKFPIEIEIGEILEEAVQKYEKESKSMEDFLYITAIPRYILCIDSIGNIKWKKPNDEGYSYVGDIKEIGVLQSPHYFVGCNKISGKMIWKVPNTLKSPKKSLVENGSWKEYLITIGEKILVILNATNGNIVLEKEYPYKFFLVILPKGKLLVKHDFEEEIIDIKTGKLLKNKEEQ